MTGTQTIPRERRCVPSKRLITLDVATMADLESALSDASFSAYKEGDYMTGDTLREAWVRVHHVVEALLVRDHAFDPPPPLKRQGATA